jgi:hypothetical protein
MSTVPMNSLWSSQLSSHEFKSESIFEHVDGSSASSNQQIWTVTDLHGPSGNTPKVPGSRPGRPTNLIPDDDSFLGLVITPSCCRLDTNYSTLGGIRTSTPNKSLASPRQYLQVGRSLTSLRFAPKSTTTTVGSGLLLPRSNRRQGPTIRCCRQHGGGMKPGTAQSLCCV